MNVGVKKGQIVWVLHTYGNKEPVKAVITSVGPKYITTDYDKRIKFHNDDDMRQVNATGYGMRLITDLEAYKEKQRVVELTRKLERVDWSKYDTDLLDKIANLLDLQ